MNTTGIARYVAKEKGVTETSPWQRNESTRNGTTTSNEDITNECGYTAAALIEEDMDGGLDNPIGGTRPSLDAREGDGDVRDVKGDARVSEGGAGRGKSGGEIVWAPCRALQLVF